MRDELPHITGYAVKAALDGFSLKFVPGWNYEILAAEVRVALSRTILPDSLSPSRLSNADIRDKILKLSQAAGALYEAIFDVDPSLKNRIIDESFKSDGYVNFIGFVLSETSRYSKFCQISSEIDFLRKFLDDAAKNVERQAPKWREKAKQEVRIWQAKVLIPVFVDAYGEKQKVNSAPTTEKWRSPTAFMEFYQQMMSIAFGENRTSNLVEILKAAQRDDDAG